MAKRLIFLVCWSALLFTLHGSAAAWQDAPPDAILETYALAAENDDFQLYFDETTLAFKLFDRRSGYLWHSGLDAVIDGDRLNTSWQAFARGGLSIEVLDRRGVNRRVSLGNTEHTLAVAPIDRGVSARATFTESGITVEMRVQLETDGVRVELPFAGIVEGNPDFRLGRVYLLPFLGAVRGGTIPGYMLLPDGSGSLIRFADTTRADNMFYGRYYGDDLGMTGREAWDPFVNAPAPIAFPVFGIAHSEAQSAFVSIVERGASYGELQVHPADVITNFNFLHHAFIYNQPYFQATNRSGAGVTVLQDRANVFDAVVRYRFLAGAAADYVGMAHSYRDYLEAQGRLTPGAPTTTDIPIRLEFLGGDNEDVLLWERFVPMTTVAQMSAILDDLALPNAEVVYYGWQPLGATSVAPADLTLDGGLGNVGDLRALAQRLADGGGQFALYLDPQAALVNEPGYVARSDLAVSITNEYLRGFNRAPTHYFNYETLERRFSQFTRVVGEQPSMGLALDGIGWLLYSDFRDGTARTRESSLTAYRTLLEGSALRLGLYRPNDYLLGSAQAYYDLPLGDNGYLYTTEPVPFLPIVLSGRMSTFGPILNFSSNQQADLLRHLEYGIYPSYFLTQEPTSTMINTRSNWIFSSSIRQWGETIRTTYAWMNGLLSPVHGQAIIAHERLMDGVYATTYEGGYRIVVNYTDAPFEFAGVVIAGRDAALLEADS